MRASIGLWAMVMAMSVDCAQPARPPPATKDIPPATKDKDTDEPAATKDRPAATKDRYANLDPADDFVVGPPEPIADCEGELRRAGVKFAPASLPVHTEHSLVCGAPQVVTLLRGPGKIAWSPPPVLTCKMALALAAFENILQEESMRIFHARVARIDQLGTYNCRVVPRYPTTVSEHSYANAIDIGRLFLDSGKVVEIFRDFDRGESDPKTRSGAFLRVVSRRANDEDVFSHVLTPFFDSAHDNHFHLDLARFRQDGTRP